MKAKDLISRLQELDDDTEIYFSSCCYPLTKWFEVDVSGRGRKRKAVLEGFAGSYVAGDPEWDPFSAPPKGWAPRKVQYVCQCNAEIVWNKANGGFWEHKIKIKDHVAEPQRLLK